MAKTSGLPELNRVSVWNNINVINVDVRTYYNYDFINRGIVVNTKSLDKPIIRYAKDFKNYSLILISHEPDTKKIEKFLKATAKKIKYDQPVKNLISTDFYYEN